MDRVPEFTEFYRATWARTVTCAFSVAGELGAAEEAAQEAYARAWQRWPKVSEYDDPAAWVRHVAVREAISGWRRRRTALRHLTGSPPPDPAPPPDDSVIALAAALDQLPANQRRVVMLHHLAGFSVVEIARFEQRPLGTIKTRLFRGRAALASLLDSKPSPDPTASTGGNPDAEAGPNGQSVHVAQFGSTSDRAGGAPGAALAEGRPRHV